MSNTTNPIFSNKAIAHLTGAFGISLGLGVAPVAAAAKIPANCEFLEQGKASWYGSGNGPGGDGFGPEDQTANGDDFNPQAMTAAHKTLPWDTNVLVVMDDPKAGEGMIEVTINDRGPFKPGRVIDLTKAAAAELGSKDAGVVKVAIYACT